MVSNNIAGAEFLGFAIRILTFREHYSERQVSLPSIGRNKKKWHSDNEYHWEAWKIYKIVFKIFSVLHGELFVSYGQYDATKNLNNTRGKCL